MMTIAPVFSASFIVVPHSSAFAPIDDYPPLHSSLFLIVETASGAPPTPQSLAPMIARGTVLLAEDTATHVAEDLR